MRAEDFDRIVRNQMERSERVLLSKATEYADESDRMHNFKVAASMTGEHPVQALGGMMVKHTVSVYDLIREYKDIDFDLDIWEEKITDHINYLLLLRALIVDGDTVVYEAPMQAIKEEYHGR